MTVRSRKLLRIAGGVHTTVHFVACRPDVRIRGGGAACADARAEGDKDNHEYR
jgi:hypothetical protein